MIKSRTDFVIIGNTAKLVIEKLHEGKFSIRSDRIKDMGTRGAITLLILIQETNKIYKIPKSQLEELRHHKDYGKESLFGESKNYDLWWYDPSNLKEVKQVSDAKGKTEIDVVMSDEDSDYARGRQTIADFRKSLQSRKERV